MQNNIQKQVPKLRSIEDVPAFLKNGNMDEDEGVKILTRFLIQDDFQLKKYGVVYDQSGFDGLTSGELIAPIGTEERVQQIARSAANIWVIFLINISLKKNIKLMITMLTALTKKWMRLFLIGEYTRYS